MRTKRRKKMGVVTLCSNNNFGNKLQNYALIKVLQSLDIDAYTIWIANPFCSNPLKQLLKYIMRCIDDILHRRNRRFMRFNKKLNLYGRKVIFNNDFLKIADKFDGLVVGSDQVWNPAYIGNKSIFLLDGVNNEKKFSYAASIGADVLDESALSMFKKYLSTFEKISVREFSAKSALHRATGRSDIECTLDPTFLLGADMWGKIEEPVRTLPKRKFVLLYFLGSLSEQRLSIIKKFALENSYEIINVMDRKSKYYNIGPSEFLWLVDKAEFVCTDSFHACAFSIIFEKRFVVFKREYDGDAMNSRFNTLTKKLGINFSYTEGMDLSSVSYDYRLVRHKISAEVRKSLDYIKGLVA